MNMEEKIMRTLEAMEHPESFSKEELHHLLNDPECVAIARDILDSREALARRHAPAPDVDAEWESFKRRSVSLGGCFAGGGIPCPTLPFPFLGSDGICRFRSYTSGTSRLDGNQQWHPYLEDSPRNEPTTHPDRWNKSLAQCRKYP